MIDDLYNNTLFSKNCCFLIKIFWPHRNFLSIVKRFLFNTCLYNNILCKKYNIKNKMKKV